MSIVFLVLKAIGWVLLFLLLMIVFFIGYILLAPVGYGLSGVHRDETALSFHVTDLLHLIGVRYTYRNGSGTGEIRLLFGLYRKPVGGDETTEKNEKPQSEEKQEDIEEARAFLEEPDEEEQSREQPIDRKSDEAASREQPVRHKPDGAVQTKAARTSEQKDEEKSNRLLSVLCGNDSHYRAAVAFVLKKAKRLLRKILPQLYAADVTYSLSEPDWTGELTGLLALCPAVYGKRVHIIPDFATEEIYARGDIELRGHIRLGAVAYFILSLVMNRDCRRLYKTIRKA